MSKQGFVCLSGSADGTVRMWDLRYQQSLATYDMHENSSVSQLIPFHHFSKLFVCSLLKSIIAYLLIEMEQYTFPLFFQICQKKFHKKVRAF